LADAASQLTTIEPLPAVAVTDAGAPGTLAGFADTAADGLLVDNEVVTVTVNA
jgi:hypothetical protein